ncbi:MAG: LON peptidase substrate-binding domain-containing protein [Deltaproteobacteria bacterium]|nr:LON peptidase substrate-binding domain-containing protein [Deltaproteobacteria bacterium]MCB9789049.1 LON peptidase substrate-binding domain-containing protein [Deltaproteobacteria bacterium]
MEHGEVQSATEHLALPLFALPEYTLFPHTLVPFHVFEPRYVSMIDHCLADRRLLVVAGLEPGWERWRDGEAPTFTIGGLGRIVSDRRLGDTRTNIFVHCIARVRIVREYQREPFRVVDARELHDDRAIDRPETVRAAADRVLGLVASLARELGSEGAALGKVLSSSDDPVVLSHRLASVVVDDPAERQQLLETTRPVLRCERLAEHVVRHLIERVPAPREGAGWIN